jgi:hypothetical protein
MTLQPLLELGRFFSFLILYIVGRKPWTGDQPDARPLPTHRTTQTGNRALSGIPTQGPSVRAEEGGSCLRPRGHCDWRNLPYTCICTVNGYGLDGWKSIPSRIKIFLSVNLSTPGNDLFRPPPPPNG